MDEMSRDLFAKGLGDYILNYLETSPYIADDLIERECARIVQEILKTLEDERLDDFLCVDRIVDIVHAAGLTTRRHDFG